MPTFIFIKHGSVVDTLKGADAAGLQRLIEQHATAFAFSGSGHTLSGSSTSYPSRDAPSMPAPDFSSWARSEHALPLFLLVVYGLYVLNL